MRLLLRGNLDLEKGFMMLEDETRGSPEVQEEIPQLLHEAQLDGRNKTTAESTL
ncbi:hypothetical protein Dimus_011067, partial [Dionaea muscipula]